MSWNNQMWSNLMQKLEVRAKKWTLYEIYGYSFINLDFFIWK